jgi:hypothetical protein
LRLTAIASNLAFILYAAVTGIPPNSPSLGRAS